ncbi:MAG: RusA family crossover junction endodeoxyribonuclease [Solirubrobacterales bacterium]
MRELDYIRELFKPQPRLWPPPNAKHVLTTEIPGAAVQAGSKRGTAVRFKNDQGKWRIKTWFDKAGHQHAQVSVSDVKAKELKKRRVVIEEAITAAMAEQGYLMPDDGVPFAVEVVFYRQRGKGHYRSGKFDRLLKPDAPASPTTSPDTTKLWRGEEDALTGLLWQDDARVVKQLITEEFVHRWEDPKVTIKVFLLPETVSDLPPAEQYGLASEPAEDQATLV